MRMIHRAVWTSLLTIALTAPLLAGEQAKTPPDKGDAGGLQHIPADAIFFVSVRAAEVWQNDKFAVFRKKNLATVKKWETEARANIGMAPAEMSRLTVVQLALQQQAPVYCITSLKPLVKAAILENASAEAKPKLHAGNEVYYFSKNRAITFLNDRAYVTGGKIDVHTYLDRFGQKQKGGLAPVLTADMAKQPGCAAFNMQEVVKTVGVNFPPLQLFEPLLKAKVATATVVTGKNLSVTAAIYFDGKEDAAAGKKTLLVVKDELHRELLRGIKRYADSPNAPKNQLKAMRLLDPRLKQMVIVQKGRKLESQITLPLDTTTLVAGIAEATNETRQAAQRMQGANDLKQLAIAMHNYHDVNKRFPPAAIYDKDGKPLLSWRVLLLPYLDQNDLYKEFRLNEPWNSPHNKKLLSRMPSVFGGPKQKQGVFTTPYQGVAGKGTIFDGTRGVSFRDIPDGTSNTIMFVEAKKLVPWSKPADVNFVDGKAMPKLGGQFDGGFNAVICDGSVRFIPDSIRPSTLRLLFLRADGMPIPNDF